MTTFGVDGALRGTELTFLVAVLSGDADFEVPAEGATIKTVALMIKSAERRLLRAPIHKATMDKRMGANKQ